MLGVELIVLSLEKNSYFLHFGLMVYKTSFFLPLKHELIDGLDSKISLTD